MSYRDFEIRDLKRLAEEMAELAIRHDAEAERKDFAADEMQREAFALRNRARVARLQCEAIAADLEERGTSQVERKG